MTNLGYDCLHRSADAGNYSRKDERVDFLYTSRPAARRLLAGAREVKASFGDLRVISTEGLIGFELQERVFVADGGMTAPAAGPADPFQALDDLMVVVEEWCPVWPSPPIFINESNDRL